MVQHDILPLPMPGTMPDRIPQKEELLKENLVLELIPSLLWKAKKALACSTWKKNGNLKFTKNNFFQQKFFIFQRKLLVKR